MPTIRASESYNDVIESGNVLTILCGPADSAIVVLKFASAETRNSSVAAGSLSYGPFLVDVRVSVTATAGKVVISEVASSVDLGTAALVKVDPITGGIELIAEGESFSEATSAPISLQGHGKCVTDAVIALVSGTTYSVMSASGLFSEADVGAVAAAISTAAGAKFGYNCIISKFISQTQVYVTSSNGAIVAAASRFVWGPDAKSALEYALNLAATSVPKRAIHVAGVLTVKTSATIVVPDGVSIFGDGNVQTITKASQKYSGSVIALCGYISSGAFLDFGASASSGNGVSLRDITIDSNHLANNSNGLSRPNNTSRVTFLRGRYDAAPSSVIDNCIFAQQVQESALKIQGDTRVVNSYLYGAGVNKPTLEIVSGDNLVAMNHLWRDAGLYAGAMVKVSYSSGSLDGAININANQFDTPVGACVEISVGGSGTKVKTVSIGNNTCIGAAGTTDNSPSAVINATITGGTTLTVNSVTSGTVYVGSTITGGGVTADARITAQVSGTPGGAGVYTCTTSANVTGATVSCLGYPYIKLVVAAGCTIRHLNIVGNSGTGAFDSATKGKYACFIDGSGIKGDVLCSTVIGNTIDDCGVAYSNFTPSYSAGNYLIINDSSITPVAF